MERGGGRNADERAAAREARERARIAREQGLDEHPDDEMDSPRESGGGGWQAPDLGSLSRYGGGMDVYTRRRLIAGGAAVVVVLLLFLVFVGC